MIGGILIIHGGGLEQWFSELGRRCLLLALSDLVVAGQGCRFTSYAAQEACLPAPQQGIISSQWR